MRLPAVDRHGARGRTRAGRLRRLDAFLLPHARALLCAPGPAPVVDLGLGDRPDTTMELADALRALGSPAPVVGVDHDPVRVERARRVAPQLRVACGGFALPPAARGARLVRAMNVLRGYPAARIPGALATLAATLPDGALIVVGRSCARGQVLGAQLLRRTDGWLQREALLLSTDFARGFAPNLLRDQLPAELHRRGDGGRAIDPFFAHLGEAYRASRAEPGARGRDPRSCFAATAARLAVRLEGIDTRPELLRAGLLLWAPGGGLPLPPIAIHPDTSPHHLDVGTGDNPPKGWPFFGTCKG